MLDGLFIQVITMLELIEQLVEDKEAKEELEQRTIDRAIQIKLERNKKNETI